MTAHAMFDDLVFSPRLLAYAYQLFRLSIWLVLLSVVFLPLERLFAVHPGKLLRKAVWQDVFYYFLSGVTPAVGLSLPLAALALGTHHLLPTSYFALVDRVPFAIRVALAFVVGEVGFYWGHRWSHEIPYLWGFHAVHHSAEHMDFLVNTKAHPIDIIFTRLCGLVPIYALGLAAPVRGADGLVPVIVVLLGTVWGFFIHSNLRWRFGFIEHVVATPAFHHWHHTNDSPELYNRNFAAMLPFLDRMFGTLLLPSDHPRRYGIDQKLHKSVLRQLTDPFFPAKASPAERSESRVIVTSGQDAQASSGNVKSAT